VAIAKDQIDLWTNAQRRTWEGVREVRTFPFPVVRTVRLADSEPSWFIDRNQDRAQSAYAELEKALESGSHRRVRKARAAWMGAVHRDRLAHAKDVAAKFELRLDPMGRGPLVDLPTIHYRDRLPWSLLPLQRYDDDALPLRASSLVDAWNEHGDIFDRYYLAHEPRCSASIPTHALIGAISGDGRSADWFALDRWAS
jgi:hypothetical protein